MSSSMLGPNVKKCPRGHPVDGPRCFYCEQEDAAQAQADEKLLEALKRLAKAGKFSALLAEELAKPSVVNVVLDGEALVEWFRQRNSGDRPPDEAVVVPPFVSEKKGV